MRAPTASPAAEGTRELDRFRAREPVRLALRRNGARPRSGPRPFPSLRLAILCLLVAALPGCDWSEGRPTPTPTPTPSTSIVSVTQYGADGSDTVDDTTAVKNALTATAGTGKAVYFPAGTYLVGKIIMPANVTLLGAGQSQSWLKGQLELAGDSRVADIKVGANGFAFRFVSGTTNALLERVTFVGGGSMTSGENQGVIRFSSGRSAAFITFRDCEIGTNSADGNGISMVDTGWSGATYHDILWERCHFLSSPRMSFECIQRDDGVHAVTTGYRDLDFRDCLFEPAGSEAISFDGGTLCGHSQISGCTIKGAGNNPAYPWGQGIEFNGVVAMEFAGNTVYRCRGAMINYSGAGSQGNLIHDNIFDGTTSYITTTTALTASTIYFNNVAGAQFTDNTVRTNAGGPLLYMSASSDNRFLRNTWVDTRSASEAHQCAWLDKTCLRNTFEDSLFESPWRYGVFCAYNGSDQNTIRNGTFVTSGGRAIDKDSDLTLNLINVTYQ